MNDNREKLLKKYPNANLTKFEFTINKNIPYGVWFIKDDGFKVSLNDPEFINNKNEWIYLHNNVKLIQPLVNNESLIKNRINKLKNDYPKINISHFKIKIVKGKAEVFFNDNINITSHEFINNKSEWIYLHNNVPLINKIKKIQSDDLKVGFPKIWLNNGTIQPLPKGKVNIIYEFGSTTKIHEKYYDGFPAKYILNYPINNFKIFVNHKNYFMSKLPVISISHPGKPLVWNNSNTYFQLIFAVYCATY